MTGGKKSALWGSKNPIKFYTDQELDSENGLYNYGARLYDPFIGRFISPDSIVQAPYNPQSLNRYSYCLNNPLIYTDPSGHSAEGGHINDDGEWVLDEIVVTAPRLYWYNSGWGWGGWVTYDQWLSLGPSAWSTDIVPQTDYEYQQWQAEWERQMLAGYYASGNVPQAANNNGSNEKKEKNVAQNDSVYSVDKAVKYLNSNASPKSTGYCAKSVRLAINAGGIDINPHPISAKDYGASLEKSGFESVLTTNYDPVKGDISVIQPYTNGSPHGHIAMYNGEQWVSDFMQRDMWGGPGYRKNKPDYSIYRR